MRGVLQSPKSIQWMTLLTIIVTISLGISLASGAVIAGAAVIHNVPTPPSNLDAGRENTTNRFQIVVKDYTEDDNNRVPVDLISNGTETTTSPSTPLAQTNNNSTTKSPSEFWINIYINYLEWFGFFAKRRLSVVLGIYYPSVRVSRFEGPQVFRSSGKILQIQFFEYSVKKTKEKYLESSVNYDYKIKYCTYKKDFRFCL